jgi:chromosome segregation ATPase
LKADNPILSPRSPRLTKEQLALGAELRSKLAKSQIIAEVSNADLPTHRLRIDTDDRPVISAELPRPTPSPLSVHDKPTPRIMPSDDSLHNKIKEYESDIRTLHEKLRTSQEASKHLALENESLKEKVHKLGTPSTISDDKSEYTRDLEKKLDQRNEERKQYKTILRELQETVEKRNKEKQELKDMLERGKSLPLDTLDSKKPAKFDETVKNLENKLDHETRKRLELEREVEKREAAENNLKKEFERTIRKLNESTSDSASEYDSYNKRLESDLKALRKRLEVTILERDSVETAKYHLTRELNEKQLMYEKSLKDREKAIKEKDSMFEDLLEMQKRWQSELRDRKELEQVNSSLAEYKNKFQQEWEQKIALETKMTTLERESTGLKKKWEMENRSRKETEETNQMLERVIATMRDKEKSLLATDTSKRKPLFQQESDSQVYQTRIQELESANSELHSKLELVQSKYNQEHVNLQESLKHNKELQRNLNDMEDIREGSSDAKLVRLKKENSRYLEENDDLKRKLREESRKRDEVLITKVKLEKSLQAAKNKLEKYQSTSSPSSSTSSPKSDFWKLKYQSKEELQNYTGELLSKLEDDTLHIIHLEQENEKIKNQLSASRSLSLSRGHNGSNTRSSPKSLRVT